MKWDTIILIVIQVALSISAYFVYKDRKDLIVKNKNNIWGWMEWFPHDIALTFYIIYSVAGLYIITLIIFK